jgi:hypothetical protein
VLGITFDFLIDFNIAHDYFQSQIRTAYLYIWINSAIGKSEKWKGCSRASSQLLLHFLIALWRR